MARAARQQVAVAEEQRNERPPVLPRVVDQVVMKRVDKLIPYARNARTHSEEQVAQLAGLIRQYGFRNPILVDGEDGIIAGHARVMAARKLGMEYIPCVDGSDMNDTDRRAFMLADNKIALNSGWDAELLNLEMSDLSGLGVDLLSLGFNADDLSEYMNGGVGRAVDPHDDSHPPAPDRGQLLAALNVTIGEPQTEVQTGEVWQVGPHVLVVSDVLDEWTTWVQFLKPGMLFCPYPGIYAALLIDASEGETPGRPMVMVQPNRYLAGHIIDRFVDVHGRESVERMQP